MRRGRWVVYCVAVLSFFSLVNYSYAAAIGMTATVPLSPLWNQSLRLNSEAKIDTSHPHILLITQRSLGIEKLPVEHQAIQMLVFRDGKVVGDVEKYTNKKGVVDFVYIAELEDSYTVMVINKTDLSPFIVKSASVSL